MQSDATKTTPKAHAADWDSYVAGLAQAGCLRGGSSLGPGKAIRQHQSAAQTADWLGFLMLEASSLEEAESMCVTNPDFRLGSTVLILPLVEDA